LMDRGKITVVQPDIGRVGGFTEAKRVCNLAEQRNLTIVPHLWKSGISIAAAAHLAATTANCAFIEFLPDELCGSSLRRELVSNELQMVNGEIALPKRPGLGVDLNREALARFKREAEAATATLSLC
jgi:L-alanine-DL-glutamate epimerase-like enolase superfamily enzyme